MATTTTVSCQSTYVARAGGVKFLRSLSASVLLLLLPLRAQAQEQIPFESDYQGTFTLAFGAGPDGTDALSFSGSGIASGLGKSSVDGHTTTRPDEDDPLCSEIVTDQVILTAANGDELRLVNSGEDCLDFSVPGQVFIRGSGTFQVVGGTGRFAGATGSGTFKVVAEVTDLEATGASGTFDLVFDGNIALVES